MEFREIAAFCGIWDYPDVLEQFSKYPKKSDGHGLFGYVFPKKFQSYETLPEDTGLHRKVKQIYLEGGYIYNYAGMIMK